jgi:hypothetical protein
MSDHDFNNRPNRFVDWDHRPTRFSDLLISGEGFEPIRASVPAGYELLTLSDGRSADGSC